MLTRCLVPGTRFPVTPGTGHLWYIHILACRSLNWTRFTAKPQRAAKFYFHKICKGKFYESLSDLINVVLNQKERKVIIEFAVQIQ